MYLWAMYIALKHHHHSASSSGTSVVGHEEPYEAHKPVFDLKPADGAFGGHEAAVVAARADFAALTEIILREVGRPVTASTTAEGVV